MAVSAVPVQPLRLSGRQRRVALARPVFVRPELLERQLDNTYRNIARHRRELEDAGLIRYQKAVKGKSQGLYTLIPFADNVAPAVRTTVAGQALEVYVIVDRVMDNGCG